MDPRFPNERLDLAMCEGDPDRPPGDLYNAIRSSGLAPEDFHSFILTGGHSDDCHFVVAKGSGVDESAFRDATGHEYDAKAVTLDLGDGRRVVLTTVYGWGGFETYIALPKGVNIRGTTLRQVTIGGM